jgi:hypothetical protein
MSIAHVPFNVIEEQQAISALQELKNQCLEFAKQYNNAERTMFDIAIKMNKIAECSWYCVAYNNEAEFMAEMSNLTGRKRAQLYSYRKIVRDLPEVSVEQLSELGEGAAKRLQQFKQNGGNPIKILESSQPTNTINQLCEAMHQIAPEIITPTPSPIALSCTYKEREDLLLKYRKPELIVEWLLTPVAQEEFRKWFAVAYARI